MPIGRNVMLCPSAEHAEHEEKSDLITPTPNIMTSSYHVTTEDPTLGVGLGLTMLSMSLASVGLPHRTQEPESQNPQRVWGLRLGFLGPKTFIVFIGTDSG